MQIINEKYKNKYLKYKNKYYNLTKNNKKQTGGDALLVGTFVSIIGLIVLALIICVFGVVTGIYFVRFTLFRNSFGDSIGGMIASILNAVQIQIFKTINIINV